jgi:hypothetical protein
LERRRLTANTVRTSEKGGRQMHGELITHVLIAGGSVAAYKVLTLFALKRPQVSHRLNSQYRNELRREIRDLRRDIVRLVEERDRIRDGSARQKADVLAALLENDAPADLLRVIVNLKSS